MKKRLPVGIERFEEFAVQNFYYVDKTGFIVDLLNHWGKVNLFTRPRRFGKSLNMSMLEAFFSIGCDKTLFNDTQIARETELCERHMGKYPVVSISLKSVDGLQMSDARAALRNLIGKEALRFRFLADSGRLSAEERAMYLQLIEVGQGQGAIFSMSDAALVESLDTLTHLLEKHYARKVILLIDEYDVPLDKAFLGGYYDEMAALIRGFLGTALKGNESLFFAVLTGCLRISRESIFTGLNNLKVYTITDFRFDQYFGFTEAEIDKMLDYYGLTARKSAVKAWYDGYHFGHTDVYCPWDVINYCDAVLSSPELDLQPQNYWANTGGNDMVKRFIQKADQQTRRKIEQLIAGESISIPINQELTYNELEQSMDNLWSVLFTTGYLTQAGTGNSGGSGAEYRLAIPNQEIRSLFITQIQNWFREETGADESRLKAFCRAFPEGSPGQIEELLNGYLWKSISIRDTAARTGRKEHFFHGMLLGLLQYENTWELHSNLESGEGYSDIIILTPERTGVVIEVKYAQDGDLEKSCRQALEQIEKKRYDAALIREGMTRIQKYGIAFYKKTCRVKMGGTE